MDNYEVSDPNRDLVVLAKKEDGSFYVHRNCGTSEATKRDTVDAFKHANNQVREGAFAGQIKQLDMIYEAINKTVPPGLKIHGHPDRKLASQKRSEETLEQGDISLISILEWYNRESALEEGWRRPPIYVPERDTQRGAHLDFLRRTEGFIFLPRPPQYPHYPAPPSIPARWNFAQHPVTERAVAGETFWPRSEMGGRVAGRRRRRKRGEVQAILQGEDAEGGLEEG
ncbi:MAG: hypothetical protein Q9165_000511 [Trypethelium subeluteriae]